MDTKFKEGHTYLDRPNKRVIIHYRYEGEMIIRIVFNFKEGVPDELDGNLRVFMNMTAEEEEYYLEEKKEAAWKRLRKIR